MLRFVYRTTKLGVSNFFRNSWLSFVTIFIVFLALFSIFILGSVNMVANEALASVRDKVDIDVFFALDTEEGDIFTTQEFLLSLPEVKDVSYVSQDQALEDFQQLHEDDPVIKASLSEIDVNPLPAALVVKAYNLDSYPNIVSQLENSEYHQFVASKDFMNNQNAITRLSALTKNISYFGGGVSILFIVVGILVVFNSIRITIYSHREEIGIMKLVGASNAFVRMPFVFESIIYATIGTVLVFGIGYPLVAFSAPKVDAFFGGFDFNFMDVWVGNLIPLGGVVFGVGLAMCVLSSLVAIRRYLKV